MSNYTVTQFSGCIDGIPNLLSLLHFQSVALGSQEVVDGLQLCKHRVLSLGKILGIWRAPLGNDNYIFNSSDILPEAFTLVTLGQQQGLLSCPLCQLEFWSNHTFLGTLIVENSLTHMINCWTNNLNICWYI